MNPEGSALRGHRAVKELPVNAGPPFLPTSTLLLTANAATNSQEFGKQYTSYIPSSEFRSLSGLQKIDHVVFSAFSVSYKNL